MHLFVHQDNPRARAYYRRHSYGFETARRAYALDPTEPRSRWRPAAPVDCLTGAHAAMERLSSPAVWTSTSSTRRCCATTRWATRTSGRCGSTCRPATTTTDERYPAVYVIQGYTGHVTMWANRTPFRQPFVETADLVFARAAAPPCVVVYRRRVDGVRRLAVRRLARHRRYHSYLCDEVVPWVDARYRTIARPRVAGDHRQVLRRLRRDDHADAAAGPVRRARHPRRRHASTSSATCRSSASAARLPARLRPRHLAVVGRLPVAAAFTKERRRCR